MTELQLILMSVAISLDTLALMTVEGSMYKVINQKDLIKTSFFIGLWQAFGFLVGNQLIAQLIVEGIDDLLTIPYNFYLSFSFVIFIGLGLIMLYRGIRSDYILEQRRDTFNKKNIFTIALITSIDALLAGIGLSFTGVNSIYVFILILIVSMLSVIVGMYGGYWLGYEQKSNAYIISAVIFFVFSGDLFFRWLI